MAIVPVQRPVDEVQHLDGAALSIPSVSPDDATLRAALAYATAGLHLVPVKAATKHPGSVLGDGWQHRSSRDPAQLVDWLAGTDHGIGLVAGRSGLVVFDIDHPEVTPEPLARAIAELNPPRQRSRADQPDRGHVLFRVPQGRSFGNSRGRLFDAGSDPAQRRQSWGEVRGRAGFIVLCPSTHAAGGEYAWTRTGPVPVLPNYVATLLPDATDGADAVTDAAVATFLAEHDGGDHPELMGAPLARFEARVAAGASRHESAVEVACWLAREARAGLYDARTAVETLETAFTAAMTASPTPGRHPVSEYRGILAWAIGQAALSDPAQVRAGALARVRPALPEHPDHDAPLPREEREPTPTEPATTTNDPGQETDVVETETNPSAERAFELMVREEERRQAARAEAARRLAAQEQGTEGRKHLRERVLSLSGLRALPPVEPLVDGFLARDTLAQISGPPGEYKTFLTLAMALCVATGQSFEGHRVPHPGPVVYVAAEGSSGLLARALAWCHLTGIDPEALEGSFYVLPEPVQLGGVLDVTEAAEFAAEIGAALLVLDTRARCTIGLEENSSTEQGRAIDGADRIRQASGCTVLAVHHAGRAGDHGRGSNAWDGAVWSELRVSGADLRATITCAKHKDWPDDCKHSFRMAPAVVPAELMPHATDQQRTTLVAVSAGLETSAPLDTKGEQTVSRLIETLAGPEGLTKVEVRNFAEAEGISRAGAYRAINSLVTGGFIRNVGTDRTPRYVATGRRAAVAGATA